MQWNLVCIGSVVAAAAIWQLEGERKEEGEKTGGESALVGEEREGERDIGRAAQRSVRGRGCFREFGQQ